MQNSFNTAAPGPTREQLGHELLAELCKPDMGAADCDFARCLRLIAEGASLDARTIGEEKFDGGDTPLHQAVRLFEKDAAFNKIVLALIDHGADLEARDNAGNTPLMCAAVYGNQAAAELLIDRGAKLDERNGMGYTALIWAGYWGKKDIATMLIRRGAKTDVEDFGGHTAADWADKNKNFGNGETLDAIKETTQSVADERRRFEIWRDQNGMPLEKPVTVSRPLALRRK